MRWVLLAATACVVLASGCRGKSHAKIGDILIPQADGVIEAPKGTTVEIGADGVLHGMPEGEIIRLAIHRDAYWIKIRGIMTQLEEAGKRTVLLVGRRHHVMAFALGDELHPGEAIRVSAMIDGKACVSPPGVAEAKCVQRSDKKHISRAYTRELVREAVRGYRLENVEIEVAETLSWADVVRVIDGARTCCKDHDIRVQLQARHLP